MCSSEELRQKAVKTVHEEKKTEKQLITKTVEQDIHQKYNKTDMGAMPTETATVTKNKSKFWSLFNKPETPKMEIETVKSYPFQMSEMFLKSITVITELINALKSYKETNNIIKNLRSSIVMIEGLAEKNNSELPADNVMDRFSTTARIITCMVGRTITLMNEAYQEIECNVNGIDGQLLNNFQQEMYKYLRMSNRITAVAAKACSEERYRTWGDVFEESIKEKTIDISNKTGEAGNVMSEVTIIGEGEEQLFYKDDVKVIRKDKIIGKAIEKYSQNQTEEIKRFLEKSCPILFMDLNNKYINYCSNDSRISKKIKFIDFVTNVDKSIDYLPSEKKTVFLEFCKEVLRMRALLHNAETTGINVGEGFVGRNIAVTKMAQLLGIEDIVVKSQTAKIISDNSEKRGFVMSKAEGTDVSNINKEYKDNINSYTGEFQRQLILLQIFDNIMGQKDRHLNNIFYQTEEKEGKHYFTGITGIDNDMCAGLNIFLNTNVGNAVGVLDNSGKYLAFDCMDKDLYEHMKVVNEDTIRATLIGLISEPYIEAILYRYNIIMNAIDNTVKKQKLIERDEWGINTYERLCRNVGNRHTNYFHRFVDYRNKKIR